MALNVASYDVEEAPVQRPSGWPIMMRGLLPGEFRSGNVRVLRHIWWLFPMGGTMIVRDSFYIDGEWVAPSSSDLLEVSDSTTEEVFATVPAGTPADIDRAGEAAARGF